MKPKLSSRQVFTSIYSVSLQLYCKLSLFTFLYIYTTKIHKQTLFIINKLLFTGVVLLAIKILFLLFFCVLILKHLGQSIQKYLMKNWISNLILLRKSLQKVSNLSKFTGKSIINKTYASSVHDHFKNT